MIGDWTTSAFCQPFQHPFLPFKPARQSSVCHNLALFMTYAIVFMYVMWRNKMLSTTLLLHAMIFSIVRFCHGYQLIATQSLPQERFLQTISGLPTTFVTSPLTLHMTKAEQKDTLVKSGRKEIGYDEETGRFFETGIDQEECVENEEYCAVDKETGNLIRLTIEEKERIFLDALQV
jgi:hypothetical protein